MPVVIIVGFSNMHFCYRQRHWLWRGPPLPRQPAAYTLLAAIHGSNVVVCPAAVIHPTIARTGGRLDTARALRYPTSVGTVAALKDGRWTFQDGQDKRNTAAAPIFTSHGSDVMFTYFECRRCNEHDFRNYTKMPAAKPIITWDCQYLGWDFNGGSDDKYTWDWDPRGFDYEDYSLAGYIAVYNGR